MFKLITRLSLKCVWSTDERQEGGKPVPFMYPTFGTQKGGDIAIHTSSFAWDVPKDMALIFIGTELHSGGNRLMPGRDGAEYKPNCTDQYGVCGLVAVDTTNGTLYRLPLPNVYDNAKLCTGPLNFYGSFPLTNAEGVFGTWEANAWNSDLHEYTRGKYKDLINLDVATAKTLPPVGGDWRAHCYKVSPNWVPEAVLTAGLEGLI